MKTITKEVTATFIKKNCNRSCHFFGDWEFDGDPYLTCGLYNESLEVKDHDYLNGNVSRCKKCISEFGK